MPVKNVGEVLGETDQRLWRMLREQVAAAQALVDMSELRIVGCDEMAIAKGHKYITAFADLAPRQVLFATPGRDQATWERFATELTLHQADATQITQVSMDMSAAYPGASQCRGSLTLGNNAHSRIRFSFCSEILRLRK